MWTCQTCGRIFEKIGQPHSCQKIPLEQHFKHKEKAKVLFDFLYKQIADKIGVCKVISLPCCIHLFGHYDFLAALPRKDRLELHFALKHKLDSSRVQQSALVSSKNVMHSIFLVSQEDINEELLNWLYEAYYLKDK